MYVSLYIWGDSLDPDQITNLLNVTPTFTRRKGEVGCTSTGKVTVGKTGVWRLSTASAVTSKLLGDHILFLASIIKPDCFEHIDQTLIDDACIDVLIIRAAEDGDSAEWCDELDLSAMSAGVALKLPIRFTVSFIGNERLTDAMQIIEHDG